MMKLNAGLSRRNNSRYPLLPRATLYALFLSLVFTSIFGCRGGGGGGNASPTTPQAAVVLEDFKNIVTQTDQGINSFSGNTGLFNKDGISYGKQHIECGADPTCAFAFQRFEWDFRIANDPVAFSGVFHSIFGLTDTQATFDGKTVESISFPEHALDIDAIDGALVEPGGSRRLKQLCLQTSYAGTEPLTIKLELKDALGNTRFQRFRIAAQPKKEMCWDFRGNFKTLSKNIDGHAVKLANIVVERFHQGDGVRNPDKGTLDIHRIWFIADRVDITPTTDGELLELVSRRSYQYFLDWSSRKTTSKGIPQDRSNFQDLLTLGGVGFAIPAHIIAATHGWINREDAAQRVGEILAILDNPDAFGPEAVGRIGHKGWFYHFVGSDGKRKLNFDFPSTPEREDLSTVELSTIDTSLALMGILAAQSYFDGNQPREDAIRQRAQAIYDRVDWPFMIEAASKQFYLGWKPIETRQGAPFEIQDAASTGAYSGTALDPATLDFYTDEALIVSLLALGSTTHPVPIEVLCAWTRDRKQGLIRSFPGSLFTYQFLAAFLDSRRLAIPACPGDLKIDWFDNSRRATDAAIQYAKLNPRGFPAYGEFAWGISAAEGPFGQYLAYGAPPLAVNQSPDEDGTITYYGMASSINFSADIRANVMSALRKGIERCHWHPRFGLPDAFNDNIAQINSSSSPRILRRQGQWVQRSQFAIDVGPMLLHLENARSGLIWDLLAANPNIQRIGARFALPSQIVLEAEAGSGAGQTISRSAASKQATALLLQGQVQALTFELPDPAQYSISVRYSNDNFGPLENVSISVDGVALQTFIAQDTGDFGAGWNNFFTTSTFGPYDFQSGTHTVRVDVAGGDGFGVEIDLVQLDRSNAP